MKKQLLIIMLALFALGSNLAFAQGPYHAPTPLPDICVDLDNPLTPVPGRAYTYEVNIPSPEGSKTYHWYVTQDFDFITTDALGVTILNNVEHAESLDGSSPILASGSAWYDDGDNPNENISLTWQSFSMTTYEHVFVVIYVVNDGAGFDGCITDNLKVYRIRPVHAFTLTIANIDGDLIDDNITEVCVDDVRSAVFDPDWDSGNGGVVYNYGQNVFYYAVAAANFSGDFQLAASFSTLEGATPDGTLDQTAMIYWGTSLEDLRNATTGGLDITDTESVLGVITVPDGSYGEGTASTDDDAAFMLYIKVVLDHNQFEATSSVDYTLALDAVLAEGATGIIADHVNTNNLGDLNNLATIASECGRFPFELHNQTTQRLMPRPTVETVSPDPDDGNFLPNAPE